MARAMEDTVLNVDMSHADSSTISEIDEITGGATESAWLERQPLTRSGRSDEQRQQALETSLESLRLERIREYSAGDWRNNLKMQEQLLTAAKVEHGSRGNIVQDILQSDKFIPLSKKTYEDLGFSYLHQAAWEGLHEAIEEIIQFEQFKSDRDPLNEFLVFTSDEEEFLLQLTPLQIAAYRGHDKVVNDLLNRNGIKIAGMTKSNYSIEYLFTPLHLAAAGGHLEVVKLLLKTVKEVGGDSDLKGFLNSVDGVLERTALHYACSNGNVEVVEELLKWKDIDKEVKDAFKYTPALLAVATEGDNEEIVKLFMNSISNLSSSLSGQIHFSPSDSNEDFGIAYGNWHWQFILLLPNLVDSYYVDTYCYCVLPTLIKEDVDEEWKLPNEDMNFFSATRLAVRGNNGKVLECLLEHIVPMAEHDENLIPSQSFYSDSTTIKKMINELMHYAARIGSSEALKVLLHFKPDIKDYKLDINSEMFGTTAAFTAVHSLYRFAHAKVDKEDDESNLRLWRGILSVVNSFCLMEEFDSINRDSKGNTLLYYISETLDVLPHLHSTQRKARKTYIEAAMIKSTFNSSKLSRLSEYYIDEKQNLQNGCNALLVGATLIAALAVSGMLQPPLPSGCSEGKVNRIISTYWTCNSLAFYFAVYTMILCLKVLMPRRKEYIEEELKKLKQSVRLSSIGLTMTTTLAVGAYMAGERLNGPSKQVAFQSTIFGLLFLIPFIVGAIGKDYWHLILMLIDYSNWCHFGRACRKIYMDYRISKMVHCVCNFCLCLSKKVPNQDVPSTTTYPCTIRIRREKMRSRSLGASQKEESNNSEHSRPLNIDDVDLLEATCQVAFMQVVLIGTIAVLVINQFAKLDGCKAFLTEPYVHLHSGI